MKKEIYCLNSTFWMTRIQMKLSYLLVLHRFFNLRIQYHVRAGHVCRVSLKDKYHYAIWFDSKRGLIRLTVTFPLIRKYKKLMKFFLWFIASGTLIRFGTYSLLAWPYSS